MYQKITASISRTRLTAPITAGLMLAIAGAPALAQNSGNSAESTMAAAPANQEGLPSVEELTEMVVKAIGGRENIDNVKTLHTVLTMSVGGMNITMDNKWSREGGRLTKSETPFGNTEMGSDGTTAWSRMPDGSYLILSDDQIEQLDGQASMHMSMVDPKELKKNMETMEVVGREEFNGRAALKVRFEPKASEDHGFMFFDASDGMPLGMRQTDATPMGEQTTTMTLGDWKTIQGVKFFHTMKVEAPGMPGGSAEMKVTTLEVNKLDEDVFALPAEVKELAANAGSSNEEGNEGGDADAITLEDLPEAYRDRAKATIDQMSMGGKQAINRSLPQLESALSSLPEGDDKLTLQYIIQELKKVK